MRIKAAWIPVAILVSASSSAAVAQPYYPASDPCYQRPGAGIIGVIIDQVNAAQRAAACQRERAAAYEQQRAASEAQQARQAEEQREADGRQRHEQDRLRAVAAAKTAAEISPDNLCRDPDVARMLLKDYNGMSWPGYMTRQVIDIEHLVTIRNDPHSSTLACHGIWIHTTGLRLEGTMTMKPNVAGDTISTWQMESWTPPSPPASLSPAAPGFDASYAAPIKPEGGGSAFQQGFADRKAWEDWFQGTSGVYRDGAFYWSAQRSLSHPGSCGTLGTDGAAGCLAAQVKLAPADVRRKTEPAYRAGWNSLPD